MQILNNKINNNVVIRNRRGDFESSPKRFVALMAASFVLSMLGIFLIFNHFTLGVIPSVTFGALMAYQLGLNPKHKVAETSKLIGNKKHQVIFYATVAMLLLHSIALLAYAIVSI